MLISTTASYFFILNIQMASRVVKGSRTGDRWVLIITAADAVVEVIEAEDAGVAHPEVVLDTDKITSIMQLRIMHR